ncbi:hydroxyacylglutathione hydrolase [Pseudidiomarina taiwanensis]|uniref:Hydroxyacylglutathione hydrolase n=1 Tax=Pseudidiomarina taiwanensis TaxID=337250 RepID=A0A432ZMG0_9GAMM|nr:hydroxyacylglutathione hydrolase [Pseudidiomarina taiwanensis]RUO79067.1 hydroxyacylglutathione hydrolase [Pseudidiomarina taiwanensis]
MQVEAIRAFTDNYIWALSEPDRDQVVVVDPGAAQPVKDFLQRKNAQLSAILVTHHHWDHTNGIAELVAAYQVAVFGPANSPFAGITQPLNDSEVLSPPGLDVEFKVIATPGHTLDHIGYYGDGKLFCGDTLFSAGCGRMFEGTPEVFHKSLQQLAELADETLVYCTHEYTQANLNFAITALPTSEALVNYAAKVAKLRAEDACTLPSTIGLEKQINPFLRAQNVAEFARLRAAKDNF